MSSPREFHFQEGFSGQTVLIGLDGREVAGFVASTRLQLGLAKLQVVQAADGQRVDIAIPELALKQSVTLQAQDLWFTVNLQDGSQLVLQRAASAPGYV